MRTHADLDPYTRADAAVQLQRIRHPAETVFERVYEAVIAGGQGMDFDDLRVRLERFRSDIARLPEALHPDRWELLASGIGGAMDALEVGSVRRARRALDEGYAAT